MQTIKSLHSPLYLAVVVPLHSLVCYPLILVIVQEPMISLPSLIWRLCIATSYSWV